ncbi:hypothetical protein ACIBI9_33050 [Nonomuraea sp. NPDC050451]|uniref:hypothetical protein n=1 Tax=Nonomuraea sp. NPDC050451 TaxID=3364364 RepID=UPI0037A1934E
MLELTALGIVFGSVLGTALALMRLSPNRLLSSRWTMGACRGRSHERAHRGGAAGPHVAPGRRARCRPDCTSRYGPDDELTRYPEAEFAPPYGAFVIVVSGGETVAGGAFRRYDAATAGST